MEAFIEQVVKKKKTGIDIAKIVLAIMITIIVPAVLIVLAYIITSYFIYISFFVLIALVACDVFFIRDLNQEYEYQVVGDTLAIDRIIAKRKRKKKLRLKISNINAIYKYNEEGKEKKYAMYYMCADDINNKDLLAAVFHDEAKGNCCLFFVPNETILKAMRPYLESDIVLKLFYNREK